MRRNHLFIDSSLILFLILPAYHLRDVYRNTGNISSKQKQPGIFAVPRSRAYTRAFIQSFSEGGSGFFSVFSWGYVLYCRYEKKEGLTHEELYNKYDLSIYDPSAKAPAFP